MAEGVVLANFEGGAYKTKPTDAPTWLDRRGAARRRIDEPLKRALERGRVLGECTNISRALSNEPGNVLTPRRLPNAPRRSPRPAGLSSEVLDEQQIAELNMGLLLGVARGSQEPPRLVVLRHEPPNAAPAVGARPRRQGHHVRHRRHLDQAGRQHGQDEGRHVRRRGRGLRDGGASRGSKRAGARASASCR